LQILYIIIHYLELLSYNIPRYVFVRTGE